MDVGLTVRYQQLTPATRQPVSALMKMNPDYKHPAPRVVPEPRQIPNRLMVVMIAYTWPDKSSTTRATPDDGIRPNGNRPDAATGPHKTPGYSESLVQVLGVR